MPKARKKAKKAKRRGKAGKKPGKPGKERELLFRVIDKLGASVATYKESKTQVIVAHFNHPPFIIDFKTMKVVDIEVVVTGDATVVQPPDAA
jgi:hypothetical protein